MDIRAALFLSAALLAANGPACAADYVSVADGPTILYDAPSLKAKKLFVASRHLPLEQVVKLEGWSKVRDSAGVMAWIEKRALSNRRFVVVTAGISAIRQSPDEQAPALVQTNKQVALEWLENTGVGWLKVRHQDGVAGYIRTIEAWGG